MRDWNARLEKACPLPPWPARPLHVLQHRASETPSPEQDAERARLHRLIATELTERQQFVLKQRFGLAPYTHEHTLREIGEHLGRTQSRVRQIEQAALVRLARALRPARPSRTRKRGAPVPPTALSAGADPAQIDRMYWTLQHLRHRVLEAPAVERQDHQDTLATFIDRICVLQEGVMAYVRCIV